MIILHVIATMLIVFILIGEWGDYLMTAHDHWFEQFRIWTVTIVIGFITVISWIPGAK